VLVVFIILRPTIIDILGLLLSGRKSEVDRIGKITVSFFNIFKDVSFSYSFPRLGRFFSVIYSREWTQIHENVYHRLLYLFAQLFYLIQKNAKNVDKT
jgi:hypothetical protein